MAEQEDVEEVLQFLEDLGVFVDVPMDDIYGVLGIGSDKSIHYAILSVSLKVQKILSRSETLPAVVLYDSENKAAYMRLTPNLDSGNMAIKDYARKKDIFPDIQEDFLDFKGKCALKVGA